MKRLFFAVAGLLATAGAFLLFRPPESASSKPRNPPTVSTPSSLSLPMTVSTPRTAGTPTGVKSSSSNELSPSQKRAFFAEIEQVFGTLAVGGAPSEVINKHLSQLNARGPAGLRAVVETLAKPATNDSQVKPRLFLLDYLAYRLRWDESAKAAAVAIAGTKIPEGTPTRYRATTIAEQSEIIEALIRLDWATGTRIIQKSSVPQLRRLGSHAAYEHLLNIGLSKAEAFAKVRGVDPAFQI